MVNIDKKVFDFENYKAKISLEHCVEDGSYIVQEEFTDHNDSYKSFYRERITKSPDLYKSMIKMYNTQFDIEYHNKSVPEAHSKGEK